ncbi:unnamed protein product, partial [Urochloa humidicola]
APPVRRHQYHRAESSPPPLRRRRHRALLRFAAAAAAAAPTKMLSVTCRRMGAVVRGSLAARGGAAVTRTYCATPAEAESARIAVNDAWLLHEFTRRKTSAMKDLAAIHAESTMLAMKLDASLAKRRDRKAQRAAEMVSGRFLRWVLLASLGCISTSSMRAPSRFCGCLS